MVTAADYFALSLTPAGLRAAGFSPIVCGDDYALRLAARTADDSAAIDLTGALLILTARRTDADPVPLFVRRSDTAVTGLSINQIVLDAQTTDNGPNGTTGRGWYQINFGRTEHDTMLYAAQVVGATGAMTFDVRAAFPSGQVLTLVRGSIQFLIPDTAPVA